MTLMYVMHHAFRRDLEAFAKAVPLTPVDDRQTWRALADQATADRVRLDEHERPLAGRGGHQKPPKLDTLAPSLSVPHFREAHAAP